MAQRNVEWYNVRTYKWCSVTSNSFAEHQTLQLNTKLLSITWNISMLWWIAELDCGVTWRLSRRNHQKYKLQRERRSAGGHDVIECKDWRETITWCSREVFTSLCRFYLPIAIPEQDVSFAALMAVIARDFQPKSNFWLVIKRFLRTLANELHFPQGKLSFSQFSVRLTTLNFHREKTSLSN